MADATTAFGSAIALPNSSALQPADAGPVWASVGPGQATVAVTFPSQGIYIDYIKPAPHADPASGLQDMAKGFPASKVVQLNGTTPALYIPQNSDDTGASPGVVLFETNGAEVRIVGHDDEATLEAIAQSILAQLPSSSSP